jgi:hypothetical protein
MFLWKYMYLISSVNPDSSATFENVPSGTAIVTTLDVIHHPVFSFQNTTHRRLDSVSIFRWNLLNLIQ